MTPTPRATGKFVLYVRDFYGKGGIYDMGATLAQICQATRTLLASGSEVQYDTIDRERVRDILIRDHGLKFPKAT